jgi:hypothetical protein
MQDVIGYTKLRAVTKAVCALGMMAALVACGGGGSSEQVTEIVLPVSIKEIKVALVNKVFDSYWTNTWNNTQTEQDWREVEHLAFQIELGGKLMKYPGTGAGDRELVSNPDWQQMAEQLSQDGSRAVNAVRSRNRELMDRAGPQLIETCDACHRVFQPNVLPLSEYSLQSNLPAVSL